MSINALYKQYFQKSKIFLYPLLDIKRGSSVTPIQTYLAWDGIYTPEDIKLIAIYHVRDDYEYQNFEKTILLKHSRLFDYRMLNEKELLVAFDFSDIKEDWFKLIDGQYSKMSLSVKRKIRDHFDKNGGHYVYIDSYLFPEKYFPIYSELLNVTEDFLKSVGELCSKPDLEKEILYQKVEELHNTKILD
jgi:hypothetical protein